MAEHLIYDLQYNTSVCVYNCLQYRSNEKNLHHFETNLRLKLILYIVCVYVCMLTKFFGPKSATVNSENTIFCLKSCSNEYFKHLFILSKLLHHSSIMDFGPKATFKFIRLYYI